MHRRARICVIYSALISLIGQPGLTVNIDSTFDTLPPSCEQHKPPANQRADLILVFQDDTDAAQLRLICTEDHASFAAGATDLSGFGAECHLPSCCTRLYSHVLKGIAGNFSAAQLDQIDACMPGKLQYCDADASVHKVEAVPWQQPHAATRHQPQQRSHQHSSRAGRRLTAADAPAPEEPHFQLEHVAEQAASPGVHQEVSVVASQSDPLPLPIYLPPLTAAAPGELVAPPGLKMQQLGLASWNLDRINQRLLPLDQLYSFGGSDSAGTGRGATIYTLDSGIRLTHKEFLSWPDRVPRASYGYDFIDERAAAPDCNGHGSIVASIAMGHIVGVAKEASLVALKVLDCSGAGAVSNVVAALDWLMQNATRPAVATLSLGIPIGAWSQSLETAVQQVLASGVLVVVAEGNSNMSACTVAPANVPGALTVSASDLSTKWGVTSATDKESVYQFANSGNCTDLFAPGVDIYAACGSVNRCTVLNDTAYTFASGTSMAVPHAAGLAAIFLADNPDAMPPEVHAAIVDAATPGRLDLSSSLPGTPNKMLFAGPPQPQTSAAGEPQGTVTAAQGPPESAGGYGGS